jgi:hypothetical protein
MGPPGTQVVGFYHNHGNYSTKDGRVVGIKAFDELRSDEFSGGDIDAANRYGFLSYLGTPSGVFYQYDGKTRGAPTVLGQPGNEERCGCDGK